MRLETAGMMCFTYSRGEESHYSADLFCSVLVGFSPLQCFVQSGDSAVISSLALLFIGVLLFHMHQTPTTLPPSTLHPFVFPSLYLLYCIVNDYK